nr:electron transfer flavoprotein subunit alpha/FixB family protein [Kineococcus siccus]
MVDHEGARVHPTATELLTLARSLGDDVRAVWLDDGAAPDAAARELLGRFGAVSVLPVRVTGADPHLTATVVDGLLAALEAAPARLLLLGSTFEDREVAARLAVLAHGGVVTGATSVVADADGRVVAGKEVLAGSWSSRCAVTGDVAVVTVKPHSTQALPVEAPVAAAAADPLVVEAGPAARAVEVTGREPRPASDRPSLADAEVVVVGGRGTNGDFAPLEELADVLGGAVGATRVATDEGWIGHEAQVGQTGVTISPRLYIGAGVSGAVHHRGGMDAAVTVVAVNEDPDAPIFEFADYGIVGDLTEVVPALTQELRRRRGAATS